MQLYTKILIGLVAGAVVGAIANRFNLEPVQNAFATIEPLGDAFIDLITMIVIPLVVASLLVGTASLGDLRKLGRIGGKTILYYLSTTAIAVTFGLVLANVIRPGDGVTAETRDQLAAQYGGDAAARMDIAANAPGWFETLLGIIPRNPVQAAANMDMLPLIFFTICFGAALTAIQPDRRDAVLNFFHGINEASMVLINWIMELAPYAVFILIGAVVANFGFDLLQSLLVYSLVVVAGLLLHLCITYALILRIFAGLNPVAFFKRGRGRPAVRLLDLVVERDAAPHDRDRRGEGRRVERGRELRVAAGRDDQHGRDRPLPGRGGALHRSDLWHSARPRSADADRPDGDARVGGHRWRAPPPASSC